MNSTRQARSPLVQIDRDLLTSAQESAHRQITSAAAAVTSVGEHGLDAGEDGWAIVDFTMPREQIIALLCERQAAGTLRGKIRRVP